MVDRKEKLLIGPRIRKLRRSLGLTQAQMAEDLGVSASYINLVERNQRPISANLLLGLSQTYDFNVSEISGAGDAQLVSDLLDVLRDPALEAGAVGKNEAEDIVNASPDVARSILRLHSRFRELTMRAYSDSNPLTDRDKVEVLEESARSVEAVREYLHESNNYFPQIDEAAEKLYDQLGLSKQEPNIALTQRLQDKHGLNVKIVPVDYMPDKLRYFDRHRGGIDLSEFLPQSGRRFQMAAQLARLECADVIDEVIERADLPDSNAVHLARISLSNYFAAGLLMPYKRFLNECERTKYDVQLLSHRFGTSFEQTAHRLTTLQRPDARGIPFFFVRVDAAGNISKRFSSGRFHFSKFGGTCPLWNVHDCFLTPGKVRTQIIRMPDDTTYFSIARTITRPDIAFGQPAAQRAIGLGCDIAYAKRLVYAADHNLEETEPTPIGVNCYLCERRNCSSRAHAPLNRKLIFDERVRDISVFRFEDD